MYAFKAISRLYDQDKRMILFDLGVDSTIERTLTANVPSVAFAQGAVHQKNSLSVRKEGLKTQTYNDFGILLDSMPTLSNLSSGQRRMR